jgi:hypothetical protein
MKIALYHNIVCNYDAPFQVSVHMDEAESWLRVSEPIEVDFPLLPPADQAVVQVAALEGRRAQVAAEFGNKLAELDRRIAELRAITHESVPDVLPAVPF